jgi:hypothetical protein
MIENTVGPHVNTQGKSQNAYKEDEECGGNI